MKVITGMKRRRSPLLSSEIMYLIFSPQWFVPDNIFIQDKLPHILKDPSYLERHGMRVYVKSHDRLRPIDSNSIDWSEINRKNVPYRVVQSSGNLNALGRVKFIFPNRYSVYLHDTPDKKLFEKDLRAFSSGCIRIEKPVDMAEFLIGDKPGWDRAKVEQAMNRNHEQVVPLTEPMPIHIIYLTSWVDKEGVLQFREDVYGYDHRYLKALY